MGVLIQGRIPSTLLLSNGTRVTGVIKEFDQYTIALETEEGLHLFFKQLVFSVTPVQRVEIPFTEMLGHPPGARPAKKDAASGDQPTGSVA
jgi:RNA chaperone Hfq